MEGELRARSTILDPEQHVIGLRVSLMLATWLLAKLDRIDRSKLNLMESEWCTVYMHAW